MKAHQKQIPLARPWVGKEEFRALEKVISSGWLSQGDKVAKFEKVVSRYVGAKFAVAATSCTTALHLCLVIAGVKNSDEVICPSFSFVASANVIEYVGAKPVFVDIDEKTFNLDAEQIEDKITSRTRAILVVHQIGLACNLDKINKIAKRHNLSVIEDAACALGATYRGQRLGKKSNYCCFSFHPRKIISTGEGGMIVTNNPSIAKKAMSLRSHGASVSALQKHRSMGVLHESFSDLGYNYRMTDLQAAIGIEQMKRLEKIIKVRRKIAQNYNRMLADVDEISVPFVPKDRQHNFQSYLVKIDTESGVRIEELLRFMAKHGISCRKSIQPIHLEPYYINKYGRIRLAVTEKMVNSVLFLPIYHTLSLSEQKYIIRTLRKGLNFAR